MQSISACLAVDYAMPRACSSRESLASERALYGTISIQQLSSNHWSCPCVSISLAPVLLQIYNAVSMP